jgi:hypothetical protein
MMMSQSCLTPLRVPTAAARVCRPPARKAPPASSTFPCSMYRRRCQRYNAHIWLGKQTHIGEPKRRQRCHPASSPWGSFVAPSLSSHSLPSLAPCVASAPLPTLPPLSPSAPAGTFHTAAQAAVAHDVMELWRNPEAQGLNFAATSYEELLPLLRQLSEASGAWGTGQGCGALRGRSAVGGGGPCSWPLCRRRRTGRVSFLCSWN